MKKQVVISLSGGLDSSTLLLHYLSAGYDCTCISFDYGQKHKIELERATELVNYINSDPSQGWLSKDYSKVKHQIIKLDGLSQLLNSSLVEGGEEVPEGHYAEENMSKTICPNRNKIFGSIVQAIALSIAEKNNIECKIALGLHSGDHAVYPDTTPEFREADYKAFLIGNNNSHLVKYDAPFMEVTKYEILKHGLECCEQLGLDFNEVYKRTNTSYKPYPSGNSDYKSASSVERIEAFIKLGRPDPVIYEDETGIVEWDKVIEHVKQIIKDFLESQK